MELNKKYHSGSYETYSHLKHNIVVKVTPTHITLWKYDKGKPYRDYLSISDKKAERRYYDISK